MGVGGSHKEGGSDPDVGRGAKASLIVQNDMAGWLPGLDVCTANLRIGRLRVHERQRMSMLHTTQPHLQSQEAASCGHNSFTYIVETGEYSTW